MLPLVNAPYETLKPYVPGKPVSETERELGISGVIKLASNENALGPSPVAVKAIQEAAGQMHDYPDGGCFYLRQDLSKFLKVAPESLIFGNGTNEIIEMVVRTFLRPGENLVYSEGSFIVYLLAPTAAEREVKTVPLTSEMGFDFDAIEEAVDDKTKLIFIANPNNPTGSYVGKERLHAFLKNVPEHVMVVLDEAYFEYVTAEDYPDGLELLPLRERMMVTRTFSKAYGLAGLRIGYGIASSTIIDYLNRGRQPFNVNSMAQIAARAALSDQAHVAKAREMNRTEMDRVIPALRERGLTVWPSQANFVLADFGVPGGPVFEYLLRQGVIVRPMAGYGLPQCARITIGTPEQNDRLFQAVESWQASR